MMRNLVARLQRVRRAAAERSPAPAEPPPAAAAALLDAFGEERAEALLAGREEDAELRAIRNRGAVHLLSLDGVPVKQIAAELGLSERHVVYLRAQLGVGRRR